MSWEGDTSWDGDTAVVTGGAGGIGQTLVSELVQRGVRVAALDTSHAAGATLSIECDVTDAKAVEGAFQQVEKDLGPTRHLVCAAGVVSEHPITELDPEEWHRVIDVSLTGTYLASRQVIPQMLRRGAGSIVAMSSGYATSGYRHGGHYAAAKAGVEAFVKSLALEVAQDGIRVNAVAPGPVMTPFVGHIPDVQAWRRDREARIPLGRIAEPADVVGPILFLLGSGSAYMTGQILHVSGGLLMP